MISQTYDTAVIGGGLAGASAAITLAQRDAHVLVLEAKSYPHHKVCGEFLSPACKDHLERLEALPLVEAAQPASVTGIRVTSPRGVHWDSTLSESGVGISRYVLDDLLANHARALGVHIREGTKVLDVEGNLQEGFTLNARQDGQEQTFQARTVIAAYGKRSTLDRTLSRAFLERKHPFIGLKAHFSGPSLSQRVELHTFGGGYCGLVEIENGLTNLCLLVKQDVFQKTGSSIETFIEWMQRQNPHLNEWLSQAYMAHDEWTSISQLPFSDKSAVKSDILMTGDAAGLITPLAGDGMEMALRGGQIAADAVSRFLEGRYSTDMLKSTYTTEWKNTFNTRLYLGRWLQTIILNPLLLTTGLHLLNRIPVLGNFIVSNTRDTPITVRTGEAT